MKPAQTAGFSLVEVILSIVIIGVVFYAAISIFVTAGVRGVNVDVFTVAQTLAEGAMEEVMANDFVNVSSEAETNFSGVLSSYSRQVTVGYVSTESFDTVITAESDYKKIRVDIRHPMLDNPIYLESIRANF